MILYFTGAALTFGILLNAFLKDRSTPKTDLVSWLVVGVGSLIWFITLPCILRKWAIDARTMKSTAINQRATIPG